VTALDAAFLERSVHEVAPELIGCTLLVDGVGGVVVECEAYARSDPASHSYRGPTARNGAMFGPAGHAYVYRSYGIHWMLNLVCGKAPGSGEAILIRALEPTEGLDAMRARRGTVDDAVLCAGPGRLGQALAVGPSLDGERVGGARLALAAADAPVEVARSVRVGISKATDLPWRYAAFGSRAVSRPWPWQAARRSRSA
jgi:DNA-3-methyladenine glycosylase